MGLRDTARVGTSEVVKLESFIGKPVVFDCTTKAVAKTFPGYQGGTATERVETTLLVVNSDGTYDQHDEFVIWSNSLNRDALKLLKDYRAKKAESGYLIGILGKEAIDISGQAEPGEKWILTNPNDAQWEAIEAAVPAYEANF